SETWPVVNCPKSTLLRRRRRYFFARLQDRNRVQRLDPRRNKEEKFARRFDRIRVLEQRSDQRQAAQSRHLPYVNLVDIDENSSDYRRASVRYEHLRLRRLSGNRRHAVHYLRKIGLAVRNVCS